MDEASPNLAELVRRLVSEPGSCSEDRLPTKRGRLRRWCNGESRSPGASCSLTAR